MRFYAQTADDSNGKRRPKSDGQLLSVHLRNVAEPANSFASPMELGSEATCAGLLHDLGKYAARFQARLDDDSIHGINHWAANARKAAELKAQISGLESEIRPLPAAVFKPACEECSLFEICLPRVTGTSRAAAQTARRLFEI